MVQVTDYVAVSRQAAEAAASVLVDKLGKVAARKKGPRDLVTEADLEAQRAVEDVVRAAFPEHAVVGEEGPTSGESEHGRAGQPYRWIVDPLDGTTNFVHGVPHFAVSVALEHDGTLLAGTVLDPIAGECFTAGHGIGARLNDRPLQTSGVEHMGEALCAVGFAADVREDSPDLAAFLRVLPQCQAIRRTGSAALNVAYVAAGRFDAAWAFSTKLWDIAAGVLLVREAGGVATSPDGGALSLDSGVFLVSAGPELHEKLCRLIAAD
jgi:myo-inositol-1(or 4)-monophosphatase